MGAPLRLCAYQEVLWDLDQPFGVTAPCGAIATHKLSLLIEGLAQGEADPGIRGEALCCKHHTKTMDDFLSSEFCGVVVLADEVIELEVEVRVFRLRWTWCYSVDLPHPGGVVVPSPPVRLAAKTREEAIAEAALKVKRLASLWHDGHRS